MAPRLPKGTPPKSKQTQYSFRLDQEYADMIHEVRTLEPHAEPGLIPKDVGSDSEFFRWLFIKALTELKARFNAQLKLKELTIQYHNLKDRQDYIDILSNKKKISHADYWDEYQELEDKKLDIDFACRKLCKKHNIELPSFVPDYTPRKISNKELQAIKDGKDLCK